MFVVKFNTLSDVDLICNFIELYMIMQFVCMTLCDCLPMWVIAIFESKKETKRVWLVKLF